MATQLVTFSKVIKRVFSLQERAFVCDKLRVIRQYFEKIALVLFSPDPNIFKVLISCCEHLKPKLDYGNY